MGRPTILDAQTANDMVAILQQGQTITDALAATGTAEATYHRWMVRGKKANAAAIKAIEAGEKEDPAEAGFREFWRAVTRARAVGKTTLVRAMSTIAQNGQHLKQFDALRFLLQAQYPKEFCPLARHELSGPNQGAIPVEGPAAIVKVIIEGGEELPTDETPAPSGPELPKPDGANLHRASDSTPP